MEPNGVIHPFTTHPALPDVIMAASLYGYIYISEDGGDTWRKSKREFGEIHALSLSPT